MTDTWTGMSVTCQGSKRESSLQAIIKLDLKGLTCIQLRRVDQDILSEDTVGEDPELPGETRLRTQEHFLRLEFWVRGGERQGLSQEDKGLQ